MPLKGLMQQGWETLKTKSSDAYDSVSKGLSGLRGQPTQPAVDPYGQANASNARRAARVAANSAPTGVPPNQQVVPSQGQTHGPVRGPAAPRFEGLRNMAKGSLAGAAAYGGISAAVDAYKVGNTDADYELGDKIFSPLRDFKKGFSTGANHIGEALGLQDAAKSKQILDDIDTGFHDAGPIRAAVVGAGRRFISALNPFGGSEAQAAPTPSIASAPVTPAAPKMEDLVDVTDGGRATPEALIAHTGILPVEGQGAFKRTTPGNEGPAYKVGVRNDAVTSGKPQDGAGAGLRLPKATTLAGHMTNLAALSAQAASSRARETGAAVDAGLQIKAATANAGIAKTRSDLKKAAADSLDSQVKSEVRRRIDPRMPKEEREALGQKQEGELSSRISHSLANRGIDVAEAKPQQVRQLMLADRIRDKIETNWDTLPQQAREFFGNKRFTSDDLFAYIPEVKDKEIHFGGNKLPLDKIMGGTFNFFSPNDPVNRDMMELIQEAQKRSKGK